MAKVKKKYDLASIVYVQRVEEGTDEPYLMVWDNVEDIDLDNGSIVGVYYLDNIINVSKAPRIIREVD